LLISQNFVPLGTDDARDGVVEMGVGDDTVMVHSVKTADGGNVEDPKLTQIFNRAYIYVFLFLVAGEDEEEEEGGMRRKRRGWK